MWVHLLNTNPELVQESLRRAIRLNGYVGTPPRVTEARVNNDGYTTVALVRLGTDWVNGYGIAVKGPEDVFNEKDGNGRALRRAMNNAIMIYMQRVAELQAPYKSQAEAAKPTTPRRLTQNEIKDWLYRLGRDVSDYAAAVDHRLAT